MISCTRTEPGGFEPLAADCNLRTLRHMMRRHRLVTRRSDHALGRVDYDRGEIITPDAVRSVRPGFGLPPKRYDTVLGKRIKHDVFVRTPRAWDLLA